MDDAGADKLTRNFAGSLQEGGATPTPAPIPLQRLQGLSKDAHELTRPLTPGCQPQHLGGSLARCVRVLEILEM